MLNWKNVCVDICVIAYFLQRHNVIQCARIKIRTYKRHYYKILTHNYEKRLCNYDFGIAPPHTVLPLSSGTVVQCVEVL